MPGRRICVVGTSGSGKTYVARELARRLSLTYICNDAIIWRAGWQPTPQDDVDAEMDRLTAAARWTFDGNVGLGQKRGDRLALQRCDTIVWLDLPRWRVLFQLVARSLRRVRTREPLWHGNVESWRRLFSRDSVVAWSIRSFNRRRREYRSLFSSPEFADKKRIRLRSRRAVDTWLLSLPENAGE